MKKDDPLYHQKRKSAWYSRTQETRLTQMRNWRRAVHAAAIARLGKRCACCGEARVTMLEIDHVNNDGHIERKQDLGNNFKVYQRIRDGLVDLSRYQTLCRNCNISKRRHNGACEHTNESRAEALGWCV